MNSHPFAASIMLSSVKPISFWSLLRNKVPENICWLAGSLIGRHKGVQESGQSLGERDVGLGFTMGV